MARFSYSTGEKGRNRVRAFEQARDGRLFLEWRSGGQRQSIALVTRDTAEAKRKADELAAKLGKPNAEGPDRLTLVALFDNYLRERTPQKGKSQQYHDRRAARFCCEIIGSHRVVSTLTHRDVALFVAERRRRGDQRAGQAFGKPVRARVPEHDVRCLRAVCRWAVGAGLIARNPLEGIRVESERNPRRPVLTAPEFEALAKPAGEVNPSFLLALILTHQTGHRIGAVSQLSWEDLDLESGTVTWRAEFDKMGREHITPLTKPAIEALRTARRSSSVISKWVIPSPGDPSVPASRHLLRDWWQRGESLAGLTHVAGRGWHSLRRLFATELKHIPLKDLCELGGWKSPQTVLTCYQTSDPVTMRTALEQRGRLESLKP
jgi:integrase